ncbi:lactonase family protein [Pseudonocardia dioxanivorans]|uniref:lactonase family protein n=1 Tax=Pseudonocardia dioxanivorans TaxID=240495 RepID=UPI00131A57AF|nr:lactonase family protein [Pseudonocardia dioxanivorans]
MPDLPLIVGTYTTTLGHVQGHNDGILGTTLDTTTGTFGPVTLLARTRNPSYLALSPDGSRLYAADESADPGNRTGGTVSAFARDPGTGALTALNSQPSGAGTCHLTIDPSGRFVLTANYHSGSVCVFPVTEEGLGEPTADVTHEGSSVDPRRQTAAHAHMVAFDPVTGLLLVPDLGMDAVVGYVLGDDGTLTERPAARIDIPAGHGPRHLAFHPDGERLYVLCELGSTVVAARRDGDGYRRTAVVRTIPDDVTTLNQTAAIRVSPSGRWVLASNRGHDSIAVLRVDGDSDEPVLEHTEPGRGNWPRELALSPDGRIVLLGNQDSDDLIAFTFDEDGGTLTHLGTLETANPVCVAFPSLPAT